MISKDSAYKRVDSDCNNLVTPQFFLIVSDMRWMFDA